MKFWVALFFLSVVLFIPSGGLCQRDGAERSSKEAQEKKGESSTFVDYVNTAAGTEEEYGFTVFEDPRGLKLEVGRDESRGARFTLPIE